MTAVRPESAGGISIVSTGSKEAIGSIREETRRRKDKLQSLRQNPAGSEAIEENSLRRVHSGIMIVRTLQDSLRLNDVAMRSNNFKLKRRTLRRSLVNAIDNNTSSSHSISSSTLTHSVSYTSISIREYPVIPGDNPSVTRGVPLSIGWEYEPERTFDLDAYEKSRRRRHQIEMRIPPELRHEILRSNGHSWKDVQASIKVANIARRQRYKTIDRIQYDKRDEGVEKVMNGFKKMFKSKKKKQDKHVSTSPQTEKVSIAKTAKIPEKEKKKTHILNTSKSGSSKGYDLFGSEPIVEASQTAKSPEKKKTHILNTSKSGSSKGYDLFGSEPLVEASQTAKSPEKKGFDLFGNEPLVGTSLASDLSYGDDTVPSTVRARPCSVDSDLSIPSELSASRHISCDTKEEVSTDTESVQDSSDHVVDQDILQGKSQITDQRKKIVKFWDEESSKSGAETEAAECCGRFLSLAATYGSKQRSTSPLGV